MKPVIIKGTHVRINAQPSPLLGELDTPCKQCDDRLLCSRMCYPRLEWAIFQAPDKNDPNYSTYGRDTVI